MARGRTVSQLVRSYADGEVGGRTPDQVIAEEPLEIRLDGTRVATTMRTPGHDYELAVGFCHAEGLLAGAPVTTVRYCATGSAADTRFNVVTVETGGRAPAPTARLTTTTSSCGWCGTDQVDDVAGRLDPLGATAAIAPEVLASIPDAVRPHQELFAATGGSHAAAAFTGAARVRGAVQGAAEDGEEPGVRRFPLAGGAAAGGCPGCWPDWRWDWGNIFTSRCGCCRCCC